MRRSAGKACGSFAGLSAAPLCTVLHSRQRTPRYYVIKNNKIGRTFRTFNPMVEGSNPSRPTIKTMIYLAYSLYK